MNSCWFQLARRYTLAFCFSHQSWRLWSPWPKRRIFQYSPWIFGRCRQQKSRRIGTQLKYQGSFLCSFLLSIVLLRLSGIAGKFSNQLRFKSRLPQTRLSLLIFSWYLWAEGPGSWWKLSRCWVHTGLHSLQNRSTYKANQCQYSQTKRGKRNRCFHWLAHSTNSPATANSPHNALPYYYAQVWLLNSTIIWVWCALRFGSKCWLLIEWHCPCIRTPRAWRCGCWCWSRRCWSFCRLFQFGEASRSVGCELSAIW